MTPPSQTTGQPDVDTRERLLAAGAELFAQKGFNGCGLSEVLRHAGVPKGSFYHWFGSKEDFGVAVIERARDECFELVRPILSDRRQRPIQRLRRLFEVCRDECVDHGPSEDCLITKLALETGNLSEPVHAAVKCVYQQWAAVTSQLIRECQAVGEIDPRHDPDRLGDLLVTFWQGSGSRMQIERDVRPLNEFLDFFFDGFIAQG